MYVYIYIYIYVCIHTNMFMCMYVLHHIIMGAEGFLLCHLSGNDLTFMNLHSMTFKRT